MITVLPDATAVTPPPADIDAIDGVPLLHTPLPTEFVNVVTVPVHAVSVPPILAGWATTVNVAEVEHILPMV